MKRSTAALLLTTLWTVATAIAQTSTQNPKTDPDYLPPPDPGYHLYFHDDDGALQKPERWGYHDGWLQGRLDRSGGHQQDPKQQVAYTRGLHHGASTPLLQEQYMRIYRSAYLRGYEHGYRI